MKFTLVTFVAAFAAVAWADGEDSSTSSSSTSTSSSDSSSTTGTSTTGDSSTITGTQTAPSLGANANGPAEVAFKYCFPSKFPSVATDTPCYSMEVLNQACYYGPSVFQTATATPTSHASPKEQQDCYCNEATGVGYMYFQFMDGCASCFREHGALGSYGAYNKEFISSLSSGYCAQPSPSKNFGQYLTSVQANKVTPTVDASTTNVLGTSTDVSLYFTTHLTGGFANATSNSTGYGSGTARPTGSYNTTTSASASSTDDSESSTTSSSPTSTSASASASSTGAAANMRVATTGALGALLLGLAAML